MRKPGSRVAAMAVCGLVCACGSGATKPTPDTIAGSWAGTTSQGTPITFIVSPDRTITAMSVGYSFNECSGTTTLANLSINVAAAGPGGGAGGAHPPPGAPRGPQGNPGHF